MKSTPATVDAYLASLPQDRRSDIAALRQVILKHLPKGYIECLAFGMIGYVIPLSRFPNTYNGQPLMIAGLASLKNYMALHLMGLYGDPKLRQWFEAAFKKAGKKLDAGKACVRFKSLSDLPLDVIAQTIAKVSAEDLMTWHDKAQSQRPHKRPAKKPPAKATARRKPRKS